MDKTILEIVFDSRRVRRLAIFGIALPLGVITGCNALVRLNRGARDLMGWITTIAGFWFVAGALVTGVYLIQSAIRPSE